MAERKDRIRVHVAGQEFSVVGGSFQEMLAAVKQINGRRFVSELKVWQLPGAVEEVARQLDISGYRLEDGKPVASGSPTGPAQPAQSGGDRIRIVVEAYELVVVGGSFQEMLTVVKNLPGRRFDPETKVWEIPGEAGVIKGMIEAAGFDLEGAEKIAIEPAPPMESLDFLEENQPSSFPYEAPDFFEDVPEIPDWWDDDMAPPPVFDSGFQEPPFEPTPEMIAENRPGAGPGPVSSPRSGGDRIRIRLGETAMVVTGGSFQQMLTVVKGIPGRRFNGDEKIWEFPDEVGLETVQQAVQAAGFEVRPE